jgi:hypothetical protein
VTIELVFPANPPEATEMVNAFFYSPAFQELSEETQDRFKLARQEVSQPVMLNTIVDLLYARRDEVPDEGKVLVAQLSSFLAAWGMFGKGGTDHLGQKISWAMQRDLGMDPPQGYTFQPPEEDPAPLPQYAVQPPPPSPPA